MQREPSGRDSKLPIDYKFAQHFIAYLQISLKFLLNVDKASNSKSASAIEDQVKGKDVGLLAPHPVMFVLRMTSPLRQDLSAAGCYSRCAAKYDQEKARNKNYRGVGQKAPRLSLFLSFDD